MWNSLPFRNWNCWSWLHICLYFQMICAKRLKLLWHEWNSFSSLFFSVFLICSFLLSSVFSIQFCDVVSIALHFHFSRSAVFFYLCLFLTFPNHCRIFDVFPCSVVSLLHVSSCVRHTMWLGQFSTTAWRFYDGPTIS
jgi:hypothetical protein